MRTGMTRLMAAALFAAAGLAGCTSTSDDDDSQFSAESASTGGTDIVARPTQLDASGATIELTFDSHTAAFDADPLEAITLEVDGVVWSTSGWDGDPPSGHHRQGTIRFTAGGSPEGTATLTIDGLDKPVRLSWNLEGPQ